MGREMRRENCPKKEIGGRILQEGVLTLDGRSRVDGVSEWEKWVGALTICLRSKVSDMTYSLVTLVLKDGVEINVEII